MARGRESKYVKTITGREEKLFTQLAKTGLTDRMQAKIFCQISPTRLQKLENSGYINLTNHGVNGENVQVIQLETKGKTYCKQNLNITSFASSQTNHLKHDLKLSATYYSLPPQVQQTWMHERDIIKEIYQNNSELKTGELKTCIDARVVIEGVQVAIEVIGDSYGQQELNLKESIALQYAGCSSIQFI